MDGNGGHPMVYGLDSVHGAQYVDHAVMFPQQINSGTSFNRELVRKMGYVTGRDTAAAGITWVLGPIVDISYDPLWTRTYETFGENPYLTSELGAAYIQGDDDLLNYHVPSFKADIEHGAMSTMENYISINGIPVVPSTKILNHLLRDDLDFDVVVVTDWGEVNNLQSWHRVVSTQQDAVELVIANTSLDMSMVPNSENFIDQAKYVLSSNPDYEGRLPASAKRIVKMKLQMGLYENPVPGEDNVDLAGSDSDLEEALNLARESIVLLKNDENIFTLTNGTSVFLTGFSVDDIGYQCGGWSIYWQGTSGNDFFAHGTSVRRVGDIDELTLPSGQLEYVQALANTGSKVVLILFEGRPRLLGSLPDSVSAGLPCEQGGQAMAEIAWPPCSQFGQVNPRGKPPITYPKYSGHIMIPYRHRVDTQCSYGSCEMQWDFGAGLSYTNFSYSDLKLSPTKIASKDDTITTSVTVTNSGTMAGKETVMLFMIQPYRAISVPEVKMLRKFEKVD
ncbi:unnamed protein product [Phytophthora fragariaefolia]|uniref:beta-glucosidase n=1 Tax=Phytophthora fragariaefolia TaxID=1490495 RepID=A0A9W6WT96_9STRA|nr:unnamed protein product [Phytophthora fragariaefolia]